MYCRSMFCRAALGCVCLVVVGLSGCNDPKPKTEANSAGKGANPQGTSESAAAKTAKTTQETLAAIKAAPAPTEVTLGDKSLTEGIPGEGDLTEEEIAAWLDNPARHETLTVALPLGLDAAPPQNIKGLDKNPLTRAKIELGRQLFFDGRLSKDKTISCASCHSPKFGYAFNSQFGIGVGGAQGGRNSPVAYNRILSDVQFWDGRAATLEDQAKGPIENSIEMANTHDACVECIKALPGYRMQFEKIFPGEGVTIDTIAKAIASFERTLVTGPSPHDYNEQLRGFNDILAMTPAEQAEEKKANPDEFARFEKLLAEAKAHPMSDSAKRGREIFFGDKGKCTACHVGANFTDEKYHNLGIGMDKEKPDLGRHDKTSKDEDKGLFKTPTVRNIELTAPYMHDGSLKTLEEVVEWYAKGGHPNPSLDKEMKKLDLTPQEKADLVEFMKALTGPLPKVNEGRLPH